MKLAIEHPWNLTPSEAIALQQRLRPQVVAHDDFGELRTIAGVDVGFELDGAITRAAVVVLRFPELQIIDQAVARMATTFPYVPGLLSFREAPAVLQALDMLRNLPDMLMYDGQGIAHPRRIGIASHVGLITGLPSIGAAKSRLVGEHTPVGEQHGDWSPLVHQGEIIGAALRTRPRTKPLYVSPGHRVGLESAMRIVLACAPKYRLPEPTRQAHHLASELKS